MKNSKVIRVAIFIAVFAVVIAALSIILNVLNIPYLSADTILNPVYIPVLAVAVAHTKKCHRFLHCEK